VSGVRCRLFAYGPADATAIPKPHHLSPHLNPDWFCLSSTGLFIQAVREKRPIKRCSSCTMILKGSIIRHLNYSCSNANDQLLTDRYAVQLELHSVEQLAFHSQRHQPTLSGPITCSVEYENEQLSSHRSPLSACTVITQHKYMYAKIVIKDKIPNISDRNIRTSNNSNNNNHVSIASNMGADTHTHTHTHTRLTALCPGPPR